MEKRELTCICCPLGCQITATIQNGEVDEVSGNTCPRGAAYARTELLHPMRIVTTTVPVIGGTSCRVSVKTRQEIPKDHGLYPTASQSAGTSAGRNRGYSSEKCGGNRN